MRYLIEGYIEIGIGSILNLLFPFHDTYGEIISIITSGLSLLCITIAPIILTIYLYKNINN
jgi:hypothetical protein